MSTIVAGYATVRDVVNYCVQILLLITIINIVIIINITNIISVILFHSTFVTPSLINHLKRSMIFIFSKFCVAISSNSFQQMYFTCFQQDFIPHWPLECSLRSVQDSLHLSQSIYIYLSITLCYSQRLQSTWGLTVVSTPQAHTVLQQLPGNETQVQHLGLTDRRSGNASASKNRSHIHTVKLFSQLYVPFTLEFLETHTWSFLAYPSTLSHQLAHLWSSLSQPKMYLLCS